MEPIKTINYKDHTIKFYLDEIAESPRCWDNLGTVVYWHRHYVIGEEDGEKEYGTPNDFWEFWNSNEADQIAVCLNVYMYEHGVITLSTKPFSCPWDSSQVGYIYVTKERLKKEFGKKRVSKKMKQKAEEILKTEISILDEFARGEVYDVLTENEKGEIIDSIGGIYASQSDEFIKEQKRMIDEEIKDKIKKHTTSLKQQIKNGRLINDRSACPVV